jgi:thioredoxin reductase
MNRQIDIIVIGDSASGHDAVKQIAASNPCIKMAFVSREFKSTTTHDFLNVEYIKDEVIFTDYKNRLFGCYLKSGDRLYCTHLIIASGLKYAPLMLGNKQVPCVFNNADDIPKRAKNQPAIVVGQQNNDIKLALAVAKKYKHVYLCVKGTEFDNVTAANLKKLTEAKNIAVLPNTSLLKIVAPEGKLEKVELDNYSSVTCSAIFIKTASEPEVLFISDKLIQKDSSGYLITESNSESVLVPKCFAVGNCAVKSTKRMQQLMVETILKDFKGGN